MPKDFNRSLSVPDENNVKPATTESTSTTSDVDAMNAPSKSISGNSVR